MSKTTKKAASAEAKWREAFNKAAGAMKNVAGVRKDCLLLMRRANAVLTMAMDLEMLWQHYLAARAKAAHRDPTRR